MIHTYLYILLHCCSLLLKYFTPSLSIILLVDLGLPWASLFSLSHLVTSPLGSRHQEHLQAPEVTHTWPLLSQKNGHLRARNEEEFIHWMDYLGTNCFSVFCPPGNQQDGRTDQCGLKFSRRTVYGGRRGRNNLKKEYSEIGRWYTGYWDQRIK